MSRFIEPPWRIKRHRIEEEIKRIEKANKIQVKVDYNKLITILQKFYNVYPPLTPTGEQKLKKAIKDRQSQWLIIERIDRKI